MIVIWWSQKKFLVPVVSIKITIDQEPLSRNIQEHSSSFLFNLLHAADTSKKIGWKMSSLYEPQYNSINEYLGYIIGE